MFITSHELAHAAPNHWASQEMQYWRAFKLRGHVPWFLATFLMGCGDEQFRETWGVFTAEDLVLRIDRVAYEPLVGLVCLVPPWRSQSGQWSTREVASVWRAKDVAFGKNTLVFRDRDGAEFLSGVRDIAPADLHGRQLVIEIMPARTNEPS